MSNKKFSENEILWHLRSHGCVALVEPRGYRIEYKGNNNVEWQLELLFISSQSGYSVNIINSTSAFLFRT